MAARSGLGVRLNVTGAPVPIVNEAAANTGDNKTYRITNAARRVWDPTIAVVVNVAAVPTAEAYTINRLKGEVTFAVANGARGVVTVSTSYLPLALAAEAKGITLRAMSANLADTAFGDLDVNRVPGVHRDCSATVTRWTSVDKYFSDALEAGSVIVLELLADAGATILARARLLVSGDGYQAPHDGLQEESIDLEGYADADGRSLSFY